MRKRKSLHRLASATRLRLGATIATLATMTGCVQLPTSGPSRHAVRATAAEKKIRVVNVDNIVAVQLGMGRSVRAFSDVFGTGRGSAMIVGPGDIVEITARAAVLPYAAAVNARVERGIHGSLQRGQSPAYDDRLRRDH